MVGFTEKVTTKARDTEMVESIPGLSRTADPDAPLWRAAQVFRLVTVVYAVSSHFSTVQHYTDEGLSWILIVVLVVWSLTSALLLSRGPRGRRWSSRSTRSRRSH